MFKAGSRSTIRFRVLAILIGVPAAWSVSAAEPFLAFSESLRERGYGDLAVEYVQQIANLPDLPADVREVLDLELSSGYRLWAHQTQNPELAEQRRAESKRLFDKFTAAHPDHYAAAFALMDWGDGAMQRGERIAARVEQVQDEGLRAKYVTDARAAFREARPYYEQAANLFRKRLTSLAISTALPADKDPKAKTNTPSPDEQARQRTELGLIEAKLKTAGLDFYTAQTYRNAKTKERTDALKLAKVGFQWVYNRCHNSEIGLRAQMWEARVTEELGNNSDALDLYDEVLAGDVIGTGASSELATLFAEAALWRIKLLSKTDGPEEAGNQAAEWMKEHQSWKNISHYQGIAIEVAKSILFRAEKGPAGQKGKLTQEAMTLLAGVLKFPNEYCDEAIALRQKYQGTDVKPTGAGFAEQMALGDLAAESGRWPDALTAYTAALEGSREGVDASLVNSAKNRLNLARYRVAVSHYSAGKLEEAIQAGGLVAKTDPNDPYAPMASSVACFAALSLYESTSDSGKSAAADRVQKIADYTIKTWPGLPAADDANIILGQLNAEQGNVDKAVSYFERVKKLSPRFSLAMVSTGRLYWNLYLDEKRKPEKDRNENQREGYRAKAEQYLQIGAQDSGGTSDEKSEQARTESRVLLAELYLDGKRFLEVVPLVEPTIDRYLASTTQEKPDAVTIRALVAGLRAYCAAKQIDRASDVAMGVARSGPDILYVNTVLVEVARLLRSEYDSARSPGNAKSDFAPPAAPVTNTGRATEVRQRLEKLLTAIVTRQQFSMHSLAFLSESCVALGMNQAARETCERALSKADAKNPSAAERQLLTRVRIQLVELLCAENRFSAAAKYVDELLVDHPRSLELLMQKGRVLQGCAREDASRYEECAAHWTKVRLMLSKINPKPKEYYDVVYNSAASLYEHAYKTRDMNKARQAEQVLKSTLALDPNLNGKETVDKFQVLLEQILNLQSRKFTEPAAPAKPAAPTKPAATKKS